MKKRKYIKPYSEVITPDNEGVLISNTPSDEPLAKRRFNGVNDYAETDSASNVLPSGGGSGTGSSALGFNYWKSSLWDD